MTEVAAEVCDGLMQHPFTTERYLRERTLLALQRGFARGGPAADGFSVALSGLVVCGRTAQDMARSAAAVRQQIAFYGSTPSYRSVLDLHGWGELASELSWLSRTGADDRWRRMGELIDDEVLGAFAVVAEPGQLAAAVRTRFAGVIDRFTFYAPYDHDPGLFDQAIAGLRPERAGPP
jgi:probable F420-dependent oxidoreductase